MKSDIILKEYYEREGELYNHYERMYSIEDWKHRRLLKQTISLFNSISNKGIVLDVGCGEGIHLKKISKSIIKGVGFDIASSKIRKAKKYLIQTNNVILILGNAEFFPLRKEVFDVIFCLEVLEHIPSYKETLLEINRVSKNSVFIIISIPTNSTLWQRFKYQIKGKKIISYLDVGHIHNFTYEQMYNELLDNNFLIHDNYPIFIIELPYQHIYSRLPFLRLVFEALDENLSKIKQMKRFGFWTIFVLSIKKV